MKKILTAALAVAMGATFVGALAACGGSSDAKTAEKAIGDIRTLYATELSETRTDYQVTGQVKVDGKFYAVDWSVSAAEGSTIENFGSYVSVGTMDESSKQVTISVSQAEVVIDYTLTASVTVGKSTKTIAFTCKVPAKAAAHAGTAEDPYLPSNVLDVAKDVPVRTFYGDENDPTRVWVEGYIVDTGKDYSTYVSFVYIVDEYAADKDKNSSDALMIASISYEANSLVTQFSDLAKGDKIKVSGFIQNYLKSGETDESKAEIEISRWKNPTTNQYSNVEVISLEKPADTRTDAEKVESALSNTNVFAKKYTEQDAITLPASKEEGVTFTWTSSNTELVTVEGSELKINSIPAQETEVTITVTAKLGSVETPKEYKIKLGALNVTAAGTAADPFTVEEVLEICNTLASGKNYQKDGKDAQIFVKGYVTEKGEINGTYGLKNVYIGTENDANAKAILVYNINWDGALPKPDPIPSESPLAAGDYVIVRGYIKNYGGTYEIAQSGDYPVITAITKANDTTSDAERVTAALTAIPATLDEITKKGTTTLATTTDAKLAIKWELTDGADVATLTGNKLSVAALPTEDKTVTLKVTVTCGTESQDKTVTVLVKADDNNPATGWNKVTSASNLQDGATILLTYGNWAMGEVANNGNFMTAIKDGFDGTDITDSVLTITLEAASEGKFYLKVGDKYLSAPTAASNYVHLKDKQTDGTSEWTITINDDETATITPTKQSSNNRVLQFNANSGQERFACYTASQKNITIYIYS